MGDRNWFRRGRRRASHGKQRAGGGKNRARTGRLADSTLRFEELELRRMLANFTVTNLNDTFINEDDDVEIFEGSLRWAVEQANDNDENDVIRFANGLDGAIALNNGQIEITGSVRILGPGPLKITVAADAGSRIFLIDDEEDEVLINVEVSGVGLIGGNAGGEDENQGGAIRSLEDLTMTEVYLADNTASGGGGAIFQDRGELIINRALFEENSAGGVGGGAILIGAMGEDDAEAGPLPSFEISNSTFIGNEATSGGDNEGFGGGVLLVRGEASIEQCTFFNNEAEMGGGVAAFGDTPPADPMGEPEGDNVCTVLSSILWGNDGGDLNDVGMTEPEDEEEEPVALIGIIESEGYNIIGDSNVMLAMTDIDEDPLFTEVPTGPNQTGPGLIDVGGVLPVLLPQPTSPAVDAGNPELTPPATNAPREFEQRGRHFARVYNYTDAATPRVDIGATELQAGTFIVDLFTDESDGQFSNVGLGGDPYITGDFSLREALLFSELNPELDTVEFARGGTISLSLGELPVSSDVFIDGPANAIVTISGLNSSRIFNIDNGIEALVAFISISNLTLQNARAAGFGGAILNRENLLLQGMTIRNSTAALRGGGIYSEFGDLAIFDSTINNNSVSDDGGGIYINGAGGSPAVSIVQSTISGNRASDRGAGITNNGAELHISYSTITLNNSSSTLASGIVNFGAGAATEIRSTIVSGNSNNDLGAFIGANASSFDSLGYNLIGRGIGVASFTQPGDQTNVLDPMLEPLAVTGGRIQTHRPEIGSPALDMGDPDAVADEDGVPEFDQRGMGFERVFDGNEDGVARIDIGAYELQSAMLVVDNAGDDIDGNYNEGEMTLREAVDLANQNPAPDVIVFDIDRIIEDSGPAPVIAIGDILQATDEIQILGPGSGVLAIDGSFLYTDDGDDEVLFDVTVSGLEVRNSFANAAFISRENLFLDDLVILNGVAWMSGGAINHANGHFKLNNSLLSGNVAVDNGFFDNVDGGALYILNATAEITGYTTIVGNYTYYSGGDGGAIAVKNSTVITRDLTIAGNYVSGANSRGGAVFLEDSTLVLEGAVVAGNSTVGSNSRGGGIAGINSHVTFEKRSLIASNTTVGSQAPGGGIYLSGGSLALNNSQLIQNSTAGLLSSGGAIALEGATASIFGSTILENSVAGVNSHGGGISNVGGSLSIRDSVIAGNKAMHAESLGGGVYSDTNLLLTQTTSIVNSTISGNTAGLRGGGVFNADGRTDIKYSTITNNSVPLFSSGSGVASRGTAATATHVQSSIIAGNHAVEAGTASDVDVIDAPFINSFTSLGHNVIGAGNAMGQFTTSGDKTGILDPRLGPLAENGGPTMTHALLEGSAAINNGSPAFNPNGYTPALTTDQRGATFARVRGGRVDSGAFESEFSGFSADFNANGRVDGHDFLAWQRGLGVTTGATKAQGDANLDGAVNASDLAAWRNQFGAGSAEAAAAPAVVSGGAAVRQSVLAPTIVFASATPRADAGQVGFIAGAGAPSAQQAARPEFRPPVARRAALHDAVYNDPGAAAARWSPSTSEKGGGAFADLESSADDANVSGEDAAFALFGEGLL